MSEVEAWQHKKLTDLAEYINGYAFKPDDWGKDGLPIIRIEQLKNPESVTDYFSGRLPDKNIIDNGDLIFSWSASLFLRIWQHGKAALNQHLFKVVEKEWVVRALLKQFIDYYLVEITKASHGSTMQHITRKELDRFGAPFPTSKTEQTKIAEILSTVDQAIEQTEALITKQQRIKTGLMQDLLTRGIDEHGNLRTEQTHKFKDSPLGRIPVEWTPSQIGSAATLQRGHDITENELRGGPYPVISSSGVIGYHVECTSKGPNVVVGRKGTIGRVHYLEHEFWAHDTSLYVTNFRGNNERYIFYLFNHLDLARYGTKSGSPSLNRNDIHPLWFGLPSPDEQGKIATILKRCDRGLNSLGRGSGKLRALKTALMQDLLTGNKRVTALLNDAEVMG
jgi:type I restriction enzyme, S subunit